MSERPQIEPDASILTAATPAGWVEDALAHLPELLQDHANCEKKAASTALALMFAYPEIRAMSALGVPFQRQRPGRYAQQLRRAVVTCDPARKLDLLLVAALIEARSAERFALLAPHLAPPVARLYADLAGAEARHFLLYLGFARELAPGEWRPRLAALARQEAQLATAPDETLRFHSGPLERYPQQAD